MKGTVIILLFSLLFTSGCMSTHEEMIALPLDQLFLENKDDGTYPGSWDKYRWFCDVEVDISKHRIDTIRVLRAANGNNKFYTELVARVVDQQSLEVDGMSGATITSNTFFKAVEEALE